MRPAFSVIFFTITSGTGYSLLIWTALLGVVNGFTFFDANLNASFFVSSLLALFLVALGLTSSLFHFANPKNSWREMFCFKGSWLSKERVLTILSLPITLFFIASFMFFDNFIFLRIASIAVILISFFAIFSTAMIYACLKAIPTWNSPAVPTNYILLGLISGNLFLMIILNYFNMGSAVLEISLMILLTIAFISKIIYYFFMDKHSNLSDKETILLNANENSDDSLSKEFSYMVSKNKTILLRTVAILMIFIAPSWILIATHIDYKITIALTIINYIGTFIERWLFFTEGKYIAN